MPSDATTGDVVVSSDVYGSRLRLNPNSNDRSYASRVFRVRLNPAFVDNGNYNAPFDDEVGKHRRAIYAAVGTSPEDYPGLDGLVCQDVSASQIGPWEFDVTADYFRLDASSTSIANKTLTISTSRTSIPVYRTQYSDNGDTQVSAAGLPQGNFAGLGDGELLPRGGNYQSWQYDWPVTESVVQLNAKLNYVTYVSLFNTGGAMNYIGYYNNNLFAYPPTGGAQFSPGTLRFEGISSTLQISGGNQQEYYVSYTFLWRPQGWVSQSLVVDAVDGSAFNTQDKTNSFPRATFSSGPGGLFPDS